MLLALDVIIFICISTLAGYRLFLAKRIRLDVQKATNTWSPPSRSGSPRLDGIIGSSRCVQGFPDRETLADRIDQELDSALALPRFLANSAVYLGLFGTLVGLTLAIGNYAGLSSLKTPSDLEEFARRSSATMSGFQGAFVSAIFGVILTLILSGFVSRAEFESDQIVQKAIERLDNAVRARDENKTSPQDLLEEFLKATHGAIAGVETQLAPLQEAIVGLKDEQARAAEKHRHLVEETVSAFRTITESAVEEFKNRLVDQADTFAVIRSDVQAASAAAQAHLEALVDGAKQASVAITSAITSAEQQRQETDQNILSLADASDVIAQAVGALRPYLSAADQLSQNLRTIDESLVQTVSNTNEASAGFSRAASSITDGVKSALSENNRQFDEIARSLIRAIDLQQQFAESLAIGSTDLASAVQHDRLVVSSAGKVEKQINDAGDRYTKRADEIEKRIAALSHAVEAIDTKLARNNEKPAATTDPELLRHLNILSTKVDKLIVDTEEPLVRRLFRRGGG